MINNLERIKNFDWSNYIDTPLYVNDIKVLAKKVGVINQDGNYSHKLLFKLLQDNYLFSINNCSIGYHCIYLSEFNVDKYASRKRIVPLTKIVNEILKKENVSNIEKRIVEIWELRKDCYKNDLSWVN
ncbi:hypothetical protein JW813_05220 [Clostridium botulinum]|uniref:hypothetical protein n=1 Tax=Clostridium botulinum TaxID=1491 RepID=UPI00224691B7|nr:hypothetical protein [Clostridium botulinum]UZP04409.1 hypothetical protein JW813_05220 [Clostridium botulinum]UZP07821.1 hypothetical protein JYA71_05495 [Clostridium botulinum]UZP11148.1 hypothetical protein JYA74_05215 [Clostridium botulinum]